MMPGVLDLPIAFADARAADLGLHLGLAPQPALAVCTVDGDGWTAELRILGASHQVLIERGEHTLWSETVACHMPVTNSELVSLPVRLRIGTRYEFRSQIVRLEPADFRQAVAELLDDHGGDQDGLALCARFPGDQLGATALRLDPHDRRDSADLCWRTWHTYPRTGELVTTSSRAALAGSSPAGQR